MIQVAIGGSEVAIEEASADWINQQINRRRADGVAVCVRVTINQGDINVRLATPTCGGGGGGRAPTERERRIVNLWNERGLNQDDFAGGNLVAFLRQLRQLL